MESVINIVISIIGVFLLGLYGVLLGTVAALLYRTNDVIIYTNRRILNRSAVKTYRFYFVNIAAAAALWFVYEAICPSVDSYAKILLNGMLLTTVSFLCFLGVQMLVNPQERRYIISLISSIKEKKK